jgi:phospholipid/cholesterol/gamma-HCH transport system substrate-binding protein
VTRGKEFLVGVVIIVAVAVGVVGTLWLQGMTFGPVTTIEAVTETVGQLAPGDAVTYRGVRIGHVSAIDVLEDGTGVRLTLVLQRDVTLPPDAALVMGGSFFGDWQAEIVSRASYPRFPFFEVGRSQVRSVPVLPGYAVPELSRLTTSADEISRNLADLTGRFELAFNEETASSLAAAIANIQTITEEVRELVRDQGRVATSIAANADTTLAEIEVAAESARRSLERVERALDRAELEVLLADVGEVARNLRTVSGELADTTAGIGGPLARADSAFAKLERIAARIEAGEGSVGRLISDTTLVRRAEHVLSQLDSLLADLRENPRRYVRLSVF